MRRSNVTISCKQSGVILFITLVALVIMLVASVALIRSTDTNLLMSGSLAFKKDIVNQAERVMPSIRAKFITGALSGSTAKESNSILANNYYATILATNPAGIPVILLDTSSFDTAMPNNTIVHASSGVTIRYVVDRMCLASGDISPVNCTISKSGTDVGGSTKQNPGKLSGEDGVVYRISMRATGPRNTETFIQSSFTI